MQWLYSINLITCIPSISVPKCRRMVERFRYKSADSKLIFALIILAKNIPFTKPKIQYSQRPKIRYILPTTTFHWTSISEPFSTSRDDRRSLQLKDNCLLSVPVLLSFWAINVASSNYIQPRSLGFCWGIKDIYVFLLMLMHCFFMF